MLQDSHDCFLLYSASVIINILYMLLVVTGFVLVCFSFEDVRGLH